MSVADMRRGAVKARRRRDREAVARVRAYEAWLKAGSPLKSIPPIPRDSDFRIARRAGL